VKDIHQRYMGGRCQSGSPLEASDLRFAAALLNHRVFAEPGQRKPKQLLAQVYEKPVYATENAVWRNRGQSTLRLLGAVVLADVVDADEVRRAGHSGG
jgi:alkyl sulfatase BDS1-like metallo-beta-lactamase superfamily hydrolase